MAGFLIVTRYDKEGKQLLVIDDNNRKAYDAEATIITPLLAKLKYTNSRYSYKYTSRDFSARYHIIHIPTGLVIADVTSDLISDVKSSFMDSQWTLRGDNTFVMVPKPPNKYQKLYNHKPMECEFTCLIKYTLERIDNEGAQNSR